MGFGAAVTTAALGTADAAVSEASNPCGVTMLCPGEVLTAGHYLSAGSYRFVVQANDGNVVLYKGSSALWATGTSGHAGDRLVMEKVGNLILYSTSNKVLWSTATAGDGNYFVLFNSNPALAEVETPAGKAAWSIATLYGGQSLAAGQFIVNGNFRFVVQARDGNVVLYEGGKALWSTGTTRHAGDHLAMQRDGNLVVYSGNKPLWSSGTAGHAGAHLAIVNGRVAILSSGGAVLWSR
jgi:hypothetical protein